MATTLETAMAELERLYGIPNPTSAGNVGGDADRYERGGYPPSTPDAGDGLSLPWTIVHTTDGKTFVVYDDGHIVQEQRGSSGVSHFTPVPEADINYYHLRDYPADGGVPTPPKAAPLPPRVIIFQGISFGENGRAGDLMFGTSSNDLLSGNGILIGAAGDDTLIGGAGDDLLVGGTGNNMLHGGKGTDLLDGTGGWSVADYHTAATAVTVNLDGSGNSGDEAAGDTFVNINGVTGSHFADTLNGNASDNVMTGDLGNDTVTGGGGNDTLYGSDGDDQLIGGAGNDRLAAGGGNNVLEGGAGADTLDGSYGWGVADYRHALGAVTVRLDGSGNSGDEAAGDVYINIDGAFGSAYGDTLNGNGHGNWIIACGGNDTVSGASGNDTLYGAEGNDDLNGGADNDVLYGGNGQDVMTGGAGADVFVFDAALVAANVDRIVDFNVAQDKIQLDHGLFAGLGATVSLAIGSMATNGGPQAIYNSSTGDLSWDADGLGGGAAVKFAMLAPGLALTANNFLVM